MKDYIFGERNGIYIIDLQKTLRLFRAAIQFVHDLGAEGKTLLFLGTKRQAQEAVHEESQRCGMFYVNQRWLGGLLTNFVTIQKSIKRFRDLEAMRANGQYDLFSKKEVARYERERKKLERNLSGIKDMAGLPDALFVIDTRKESIAVQEARKLDIPIIGIADTNCNPDEIDYIIPGNDDALRAIRLITGTIAQAYMDGRAVHEARQKELAEQMEKERQRQAEEAAAAREKAAAVAAAQAAARKAAVETEGAGQATAPSEDASDASTDGESAAKPRTKVRKTLQRRPKSKTKKVEAQAEAEADPSPKTVEEPQSEGQSAEPAELSESPAGQDKAKEDPLPEGSGAQGNQGASGG